MRKVVKTKTTRIGDEKETMTRTTIYYLLYIIPVYYCSEIRNESYE
jgi:hypothetical protein